jgi:hypothetical protein
VRGKTVLVVVEAHPNYDFYKSLNQEFAKNWYLTDSVHFIVDTLVKRDLNSFGKDTIIIVWKIKWQKMFTNRNCMSYVNPCDCLIWTLGEHLTFKNFQNKNWETYAFIYPNKEINHLNEFQNLITNSKYVTSYKGKKVIIKNQCWSKETELLINEWLEGEELKIIQGYYHDNKRDDAVYIYQRNYPSTNYIEIIDLKTNRVIEKIELESK